jgi:hypothetical protein
MRFPKQKNVKLFSIQKSISVSVLYVCMCQAAVLSREIGQNTSAKLITLLEKELCWLQHSVSTSHQVLTLAASAAHQHNWCWILSPIVKYTYPVLT